MISHVFGPYHSRSPWMNYRDALWWNTYRERMAFTMHGEYARRKADEAVKLYLDSKTAIIESLSG